MKVSQFMEHTIVDFKWNPVVHILPTTQERLAWIRTNIEVKYNKNDAFGNSVVVMIVMMNLGIGRYNALSGTIHRCSHRTIWIGNRNSYLIVLSVPSNIVSKVIKE